MKYTQEQIQKGNELISSLIQKALESASFKDKLVSNPLETINQFTENTISLVGKQHIVVEDQTDSNTIYFNIPSRPNFNELELTEEQLEMVSGGITPSFIAIGYGFVTGIALAGAAAAVAGAMK